MASYDEIKEEVTHLYEDAKRYVGTTQAIIEIHLNERRRILKKALKVYSELNEGYSFLKELLDKHIQVLSKTASK